MTPVSHRARRVLATAVLAAVAALPAARAAEPPADDPAVQPSELLPLSTQTLLLDAVRTGAGVFAVGERGIALRRGDSGQWAQLPTPTRVTLTAVAAADGELWVAGHDGVILRSSDNGDSWTRQRVDVWSPQSTEPSQGAPILDLLFIGAEKGYAVGAFSTLLRTNDGGRTWVRLSLKGETPAAEAGVVPEPDAEPDAGDTAASFDDGAVLGAEDLELADETDPHLNAIARDPAGTLYIAGERGAMFRSRDDGSTWQRLSFPYEGSMFGIVTWDAGHVMAFGLRGNVFESTDGGDTWSRLDTGAEVTLMGGSALPGGGVVIVGNEGVILERKDGASPLERREHQNARGETPVLSGAIPDADGTLILIGDKGVDRDGHG